MFGLFFKKRGGNVIFSKLPFKIIPLETYREISLALFFFQNFILKFGVSTCEVLQSATSEVL